MSEAEQKQAEKAQKEKSIVYLRWFDSSVVTHFPVCIIPVVKSQEWLNYTGYPEKGQETCDEHEHLKFPYFCFGKMTFCENNTDDQEYNRFHQLKELHSWNIVY